MAPTKSAQSMLVTGKGVTKSIVSMSRRAIPTRTQQQKVHVDGLQNEAAPVGKRKADISPTRNDKNAKRSALGNVTHAVLNVLEDSKKSTRSKTEAKKTTTTVTNVSNGKQTENEAIFVAPNATAAAQRAHKIVTRSTAAARTTTDTNINSTVHDLASGLKKASTSISNAVKVKKKTEASHAHNNNNNAKAVAKANAKSEAALLPSSESDEDSKPNPRRISNEFDILDNEDNSHYMSALEDL